MTDEDRVIERMAHAICQKSPGMFGGEGHGCGASCRAMLQYGEAARAAYSIAREEIERGLIAELMEPTTDMLAAALPLVELESLSREAKEAGAAAVMYLSGEQRIIPQLEGEAVIQAAQLYTDWQAMLRAFHSSRGE